MVAFKKATKEQAKLRLALIGLAGSGKTYSALAIATSLVPGGRVALIDTERGSASLYADRFSFDTLDLERHAPDDYVEAIQAAEQAGYDVIVVDSLSHAWAGRDGALEQVDKIAKREGRTNNFTAWRDVTPQHNKLVDAMLSCKMHLVATLRSKMEYVLEPDEKGKMVPRKIGLAPIQREGLDYEFTLVGDMNLSHALIVSKSRCLGVCEPGDIVEKPGEKFAAKLRDWLSSGVAPKAEVAAFVEKMAAPDRVAEGVDAAFVAYLAAMESATDVAMLERAATGPGKPPKGSSNHDVATATFRRKRTELASSNGARA
jgi:hypothetical protein